ncbi:MAG: hypothetical protein HZB43_00630 [candidate division Zixibacteria bacterium]|nr:hypothetical protein [candidate division Zixibacteria bacterium]
MEKLHQVFAQEIGIPLTVLTIPDCVLEPLDGPPDKALLYGSPSAKKNQFLIQGDIFHKFISDCQIGYFLIGFWGHGVNSYAFYYARVDEQSKICFRLPYGGVYMDNKECAAEIARFLSAFAAFEHRLAGCPHQLVAIDAMAHGRYRLELPGDVVVEHNDTLLHSADFAGQLLPPEWKP